MIDLTDSITPHTEHYEGNWKNADGKPVTSVDVTYHAQYNRIYHSPVQLNYRQMGYENFDYFGDHYYQAQNLAGERVQVPLVYPVRKKDWPEGRKDSLEAKYVFDYPVFDIERGYPFKLSATETYYYNNNTKSDTIDVVRLSGGFVTIRNSMISSTHRDTLTLDSVGEATYIVKAAQTPYMVSGKDALYTLNMTMLMDGTYYEATPLKAQYPQQVRSEGRDEHHQASTD